MKKHFVLITFTLLFLQGCGYWVTTVYDHCTTPSDMYIKDISGAYILDRSIRYVSEVSTLENDEINGKFELCIGRRCPDDYGNYRPVKVVSPKAKLTGRMRKIAPKLLLSAFLSKSVHVEAIVDGRRVWVRPFDIEDKFLMEETNASLTLHHKNSIFTFQCPLDDPIVIDNELSL